MVLAADRQGVNHMGQIVVQGLLRRAGADVAEPVDSDDAAAVGDSLQNRVTLVARMRVDRIAAGMGDGDRVDRGGNGPQG